MNTTFDFRRVLILTATVMALALLTWAGWGFIHGERDRQSTNDAFVAADFTLLAPKVAGLVASVEVQDNQAVKAGQLLASLDDGDYRAAVAVAEGERLKAQASLENARASLERQASLIAQAAAAVTAEDAELSFAQHELQRYQHLAQSGAGTVQNAQQAQSRIATATARLQQDRAALAAAHKQTDILAALEGAAQGELQAAQARLAQAQLQLGYTRIVAPFDGVVGRRALRAGAYVKPGDTLLALVPLAQAYVVANFQETQLTQVRPGLAVEVAVDMFPGQPLRGRVDSLAPATGVTFAAVAPDNATGNFTKVVQRIPVKIVFEPEQPLLARLRVGMSVEAAILDREPTSVPGKALAAAERAQ